MFGKIEPRCTSAGRDLSNEPSTTPQHETVQWAFFLSPFWMGVYAKCRIIGPMISFPRYTEVANQVQSEDTIQNIQFCLLDCSPLKFAVLGHCQEWQNKFTSLLKHTACEDLQQITAYLDENSKKFVSIHCGLSLA